MFHYRRFDALPAMHTFCGLFGEDNTYMMWKYYDSRTYHDQKNNTYDIFYFVLIYQFICLS